MGRFFFAAVLFILALLPCADLISDTVAIPELVFHVSDTVYPPGVKRARIQVYVDNYMDTVVAFQFLLRSTRPDLVKFGGFDSTGTLVSGFDLVEAYDMKGDSSELLLLAFADLDPHDGSTAYGFAPQQGEIAVYILVNTTLSPDTGFVSLIEVDEPLNFSAPRGRSIGVITETIVDTLYYSCLNWSADSCVNWVEVDPVSSPYDSVSVDTSLYGYLDSSKVVIIGGSVTVWPGFCQACDMDCDGLVDIGDLTKLISCLYIVPGGCEELGLCDWDCNGEVDIGDLTGLIRYLYLSGAASTCSG
jgi:hypothetical protein